MGHIGKSTAWRCVLAGFLVLIINSVVLAADDSPGTLLETSLRLMDAKKYDEAAEKMVIYLDMVADSQADRVIAIAQEIRFKLATILIEENRLDEAAEVLNEYIEKPLCKYPRQGMKMLATCYYEIGKPEIPGDPPEKASFEACVTAIETALEYNENPIVFVKAVSGEKEEDDGSGVLAITEDDDPEYTTDELVLLHVTLGEALFGLERWAECIDPFTYVIENTTEEQRKGYAIMQVINALIEIPDFARITEWIPQLYRTEARYDIRVNLALMNVAAALYTAKEYDSALPLYRMILPRDEVIAFQQEQLRNMRINAGMGSGQNVEMTEAEILLFSPDVVEEDPEQSEPEEDETPKEVLELESLIAALEDLPAYENNIDYRMAKLYQEVDRYWEAVRFLDSVYAAEPTSELGERAIADVVTALLDNLDELEEAQERAYNYMAKHREGATPRKIAYNLTGHYHETKAMEEIKALQPYLDNFVRTNDTAIMKYDAELYFMQGVASLLLFDYENSEKGFKRVLDEFPDSHQESNAHYWYGASKLYLQKYAEAWPIFEQYISDFPDGKWIDEAYFQGGICLFGMEQYTNASERFTLVIDKFPESGVYPNACAMRGDLYGSDGLLDEAIADYKRAIAAAVVLGNVKQATYSTFQMAEVYEAWAEAEDEEALTQEKYDELIIIVQDYLDTWQAEADIAKALFWIGRIKIQLGFAEEAVATYLDAIVKFGSDVKQDGVDMMIAELVKVSTIWLGIEAQARLMDDLQTALDAADNPVLKLRLRVTMAKLDYTEIELGKQLIRELPDLKNASPPVLATICDASFEMKDYSRAEELLSIFITRFEESDYMRAAYKLRAYGQYAEKDYEGAILTIEEAQETYGHDRDVVWAQLMRAQILYDDGKLDEAREANMYILSIPAWRGEPVAQATYHLGQIEERDGNPRKAFGFYQRTYVQYKGYAAGYWAAESYLASARCLKTLGLEEERINTYRAILFDTFVNGLPQAEEARKALGSSEVAEIETYLYGGGSSNVVIAIDTGKMVDTTLLNIDQTDATATETDTEEPAGTETNKAVAAEVETIMEEPAETETDVVGMEGGS